MIDDTALKTGLCKAEQKYFSVVSPYAKFQKDLSWGLWTESKSSRMSQYKVSGCYNLGYIHVKCFKWEINNPFQSYRNSLEADSSLGNKILA